MVEALYYTQHANRCFSWPNIFNRNMPCDLPSLYITMKRDPLKRTEQQIKIMLNVDVKNIRRKKINYIFIEARKK